MVAHAISKPRSGNPLNDHDLLTTAIDCLSELCANEPLITTTMKWSIAHNLGA
jgi:hypothetical protein